MQGMFPHLQDHNYHQRFPTTLRGLGRRRRLTEESLPEGSAEPSARRFRGADNPAVRPSPQPSSAPQALPAPRPTAPGPGTQLVGDHQVILLWGPFAPRRGHRLPPHLIVMSEMLPGSSRGV